VRFLTSMASNDVGTNGDKLTGHAALRPIGVL
jgi:hypothetical protein